MPEYFDVVDEKDNVIGRATRGECHKNRELIHRGIHVLIFNSDGDVLLQKRSRKVDLYPGKWTVSVAGHVGSGEDYMETAKREMEEEIGIETEIEPVSKFLFSGEKERETIRLFKGVSDGPFRRQPEEVDDVRFFSPEEIKKMLRESPESFSPDCFIALNKYFKG